LSAINVYNSFDEIERDPETTLTVGTFDGVHRGHCQIIDHLLGISHQCRLRHVLITIHPHPQIVLANRGREPIRLLTSIEERIELLRRCGVENVLVLPFDYEFSQVSPKEFIEDYLYKKVGLRRILVGYDHMFGKNRRGDLTLLREMSAKLNFDIERIERLDTGSITVSSTKIRHAVADGEIEMANRMLGYEYLLKGRVVKGDGRGASIGYPTANIEYFEPNKLVPARGVYLVRGKIAGQRRYGMANVGTRPTFTNDKKTTVEVYFFGLEQNLYGEEITLEFLNYLRAEQKFSSVDELIKQMNRDKEKSLELIDKFYI
jgi:riboflavin kinase/FMN adenylyltransferase